MKYKINEIFYSLQGEGANAGQAAVFIRFAGCNLKCNFCDTSHEATMELTAAEIVEYIMTKTALKDVSRSADPWIIFTGGEPTLQLDKPLITVLGSLFPKLAIETNGTQEIPSGIRWKTVSPKLGQKGWVPAPSLIIDETKFIVTDTFAVRDAEAFIQYVIDPGIIYLQPESEKPDSIARAIQIIKEERPAWRLSIQTQKILNIQ